MDGADNGGSTGWCGSDQLCHDVGAGAIQKMATIGKRLGSLWIYERVAFGIRLDHDCVVTRPVWASMDSDATEREQPRLSL